MGRVEGEKEEKRRWGESFVEVEVVEGWQQRYQYPQLTFHKCRLFHPKPSFQNWRQSLATHSNILLSTNSQLGLQYV